MNDPSGINQELTNLTKEIASLEQIVRDLEISEAERKPVTEALLESPGNNTGPLVDNINFGINLIDKDFKIVAANSVSGKQFNKPAGELVGKKLFLWNSKNGRKSVSTAPGVQGHGYRVQPHQVDAECIRDDGQPFCGTDSRLPAFFIPTATVQGVSMKLSKTLPRGSKQRRPCKGVRKQHRLLIENSHDIIYTLNPEGTVHLRSPCMDYHFRILHRRRPGKSRSRVSSTRRMSASANQGLRQVLKSDQRHKGPRVSRKTRQRGPGAGSMPMRSV